MKDFVSLLERSELTSRLVFTSPGFVIVIVMRVRKDHWKPTDVCCSHVAAWRAVAGCRCAAPLLLTAAQRHPRSG